MSNFYENPPQTRDDIKEYLTTWLQDTNDSTIYTINNQKYMNEKSFRRAFYIHSIFRNIDTNEYVWYVIPGEDMGNFSDFPERRYADYESLIEHVVNDYYKEWILKE
jgi:hypothetical protein